jgi:uncharacterized protein YgiM (DUF1202 family)
MRIIIIPVLLSVVIFIHGRIGAVPGAQETEREQYFYVLKHNVNIRTSPGYGTRVIMQVDSGDIFKSNYTMGGWILAEFPGGLKGFIHSSLVASYEMEQSSNEPVVHSNDTEDYGSVDFCTGALNGDRETEGRLNYAHNWRLTAAISLLLNILFVLLVIRRWYIKKRMARDYDMLKELTKMDESKETLRRELFLALRHNQRLEKVISSLKGNKN